MNKNKIVYLSLRLVMGFIFLWAFVDKLFGLGFATKSENSWLNGGSPTAGFLTHGVKGPFADFFTSLAGMALIDWMFMLGLLLVGVTLLINRYVFWGCVVGSIMMFLVYLAALPPDNNPFLDDHIVYILVFAVLGLKARAQVK